MTPFPRILPAKVEAAPVRELTDPKLLALRERILRVLALVTAHLPAMTPERAGEIAAGLGSKLAAHATEIPAALAEALAELKAPMKDDGIGNIVAALRAVNNRLRLGDRLTVGLYVGYVKAELKEPANRARLPALVREMVRILEGKG